MDELCEDKSVQFSIDGPSVGINFFQVFQDGRKKKGLQQTLVIGSCGLYTPRDLLKLV